MATACCARFDHRELINAVHALAHMEVDRTAFEPFLQAWAGTSPVCSVSFSSLKLFDISSGHGAPSQVLQSSRFGADDLLLGQGEGVMLFILLVQLFEYRLCKSKEQALAEKHCYLQIGL